MEVYVENMFDDEPDLLLALAKELSDVPHFGVCLDFAHAYLSKNTTPGWNNALRPYTRHLHINDNFRWKTRIIRSETGHFPGMYTAISSTPFPRRNAQVY